MVADEVGREAYLLAQVRESFGRVVYSHKTHEKEADKCHRWHLRYQWILAIVTAASSGTFVGSLAGLIEKPWVEGFLVPLLALMAAIGGLIVQRFEFSKRSESHKRSASDLWNVRESYISLIADLQAGDIDLDEARELRDELQQATFEVYSAARRTSKSAWGAARKALKKDEEMTFSPKEIDQFLPYKLRSS